MTSYMPMAGPRYDVPQDSPNLGTPEQARPRRFCLMQYSLVWIYTGSFGKSSSLEEGHLPTRDEASRINITAYPPDDNDNENDQLCHCVLYSYGDPTKWASFLSFSNPSESVDNTHNFGMMVTEGDFIREDGRYDKLKTLAIETLKQFGGESNFIVKDAGGDAVMDDNGNKMLFVKFPGESDRPYQRWVFQFKRIVNGQESSLTEREKKRLGLYLAGAMFGGPTELPQRRASRSGNTTPASTASATVSQPVYSRHPTPGSTRPAKPAGNVPQPDETTIGLGIIYESPPAASAEATNENATNTVLTNRLTIAFHNLTKPKPRCPRRTERSQSGPSPPVSTPPKNPPTPSIPTLKHHPLPPSPADEPSDQIS